MEEDMFCYIHEGGQLVKCAGGSVEYQGGRTESMVVSRHMSHSDFISKLCDELHFDRNSIKLEFTVKFDPSCLLLLHDDAAILKMFRFNERFCRVYVSSSSEVVEACISSTSAPTPIVGSNSAHVLSSGGDMPIDICNDSLTIESCGFSQRCAESNILKRDSRRFENSIMGSGHTFPNAAKFRDAVYLMSIAGRFRYCFKRNSTKHMTVVCTVNECPWKVTARAIGESNIIQVHTFQNRHNHSLEDVAACQPLVRSNRASLLIDDVIRSTPDYQPRQICKDFQRQHGMQLTYLQAWNIKEKANERIYGEPKNYYKLLPWMCEKMVATNPGSIVELRHSSDGHFEQLFVAHSISIQGFAMGCRPIIAIDSAHMSGPYRGALFSATAYDANDSMFPLAFGVMSLENYDDWSWFLQNLKKVVGDKEVVIISDRRPALLRSVPEVFGLENHAYCYRHLKENFSSFLSKHNTKGNKGKENALQLLDSIAYARLEHDYNVSMFELRKYNDTLATWVEENAPEHWAMSKFPKQRWDKMTTNLAESFNAWLRNERHHSIYNFLMEHMAKLGSMLVKHKEESNNWKGCIGPKIEDKVQQKIAKGEVYPVTPLMNGTFGVSIGSTFLNVDIMKRTCTCRGWEMLGIPCEHAAAVILSIGQNVVDFVQDWYKFPMQELIYSGSFSGIETHDMPIVDNDGLVRSIIGEVFFSLNPPHTKCPPGRPRKKRLESQFQDKRTVYCSRCHTSGHNRKTCKNPLS
ncbi:uncharacterized protein LOC100245246 isoform X1 [Vitis vinifera]|uniref:uncharacterized protein LOC100245246 isoform X1 n=1 Tax=Vitis vinifera TaxID=29760 RepID=UPI00053FD257|nr:uncharacterized protein LOC100245246 isoform X1 [Vitis vinifera]XP_059591764.1 uncharacterized protein LOC100245246 isoform X1 [Vitis vinifera]XP_059591765.1 uncharacterized protein LOC100245246 isoform X1 [Vitis vinifera]XP_059591766.1 uncharacterized protein LOC100245246 isoform X1 [Vitis vinifera]XP_059591767.1 uncharacterized protein LOC100245246 isoform X1 [Vitis vinifera]XP_059591768.1 uncharacterized protein LOC100245246 isoform X1 [Vitis vinifera]XP_059591769.1 uncharacterized prot|eukprot:XP_019074365.1 PREDICTED: uncharacterized protein LOC100255550 [Vitis vinifera]